MRSRTLRNRVERLRDDNVYAIAQGYALVLNRELCEKLEQQLNHYLPKDIRWLQLHQVGKNCDPRIDSVDYPFHLVETFSVYQAFFMGVLLLRVGFYGKHTTAVASNCIQAAIKIAGEEDIQEHTAYVMVAGHS